MRHSFSVQGQIEFFHSSIGTQMYEKSEKYVRHCRVDCGLISSLFCDFFPLPQCVPLTIRMFKYFHSKLLRMMKNWKSISDSTFMEKFRITPQPPSMSWIFLFFPLKKSCCINHSIITINKSISSIANFYELHNNIIIIKFIGRGLFAVCGVIFDTYQHKTQQRCRWGPRNEWETIH